MVTGTQLSRLDAKVGALAAAIDTESQAISVVIFRGETREFALQRHRELRPDHASCCGSSTGTRNATRCAKFSRSTLPMNCRR